MNSNLLPLRKLISYISKGIAPKYIDDNNNCILVLNQKCNREFKIDTTLARFHDLDEKLIPHEKYLKSYDILINSTGTGTAGRIAQINQIYRPTTVDGHMIILRANSIINPIYLGYALKFQQRKIEGLAEGSTGQTEINKQRLCDEILINLPPIETQQKIAKILSAIDDKIELNQKINANLEQQAQAIFNEWFGKYDENNIPNGWKIGKISDLGNVIGGSTPSKKHDEYYTHKGIAWITPKDLSINKNKFIAHGEIDITKLGFNNSSTQLMPKKTVLFSSRAPIGYIAISKNDITTNQGFKSIVPYSSIGTAYVYYYLKNNILKIENMASGSTFKEISGSVMKNIPALIPSKDILNEFKIFCNYIFYKQELLENEIETLKKLRDALLPKLMNGEIDVENVEI